MTTSTTPRGLNETRVITPVALISYPHIKAPQKGQNGQKPKYSAALLFVPALLTDAAEKARLDLMRKALQIAGQKKFGDKFAALWKQDGFRKAFRSDEKEGYPEGTIYINARSDNRPSCVYSYAETDGPNKGKPAQVPEDKLVETFYPGAKVRAIVSAFGYDNNGNRGVSFSLEGLQFVGDGERLDNRVPAQDVFTADLTQAPASLEDLIDGQ